MGITADGVETSSPEITTAKTVLTMSSSRKITTRNSRLPRRPMYFAASVPMDWPRLRVEAHRAPRSCMPAKNTVPRVTQRKAGPQPQITATAGPTIGEAPATEVKWWPHSTNLLVGT